MFRRKRPNFFYFIFDVLIVSVTRHSPRHTHGPCVAVGRVGVGAAVVLVGAAGHTQVVTLAVAWVREVAVAVADEGG